MFRKLVLRFFFALFVKYILGTRATYFCQISPDWCLLTICLDWCLSASESHSLIAISCFLVIRCVPSCDCFSLQLHILKYEFWLSHDNHHILNIFNICIFVGCTSYITCLDSSHSCFFFSSLRARCRLSGSATSSCAERLCCLLLIT